MRVESVARSRHDARVVVLALIFQRRSARSAALVLPFFVALGCSGSDKDFFGDAPQGGAATGGTAASGGSLPSAGGTGATGGSGGTTGGTTGGGGRGGGSAARGGSGGSGASPATGGTGAGDSSGGMGGDGGEGNESSLGGAGGASGDGAAGGASAGEGGHPSAGEGGFGGESGFAGAAGEGSGGAAGAEPGSGGISGTGGTLGTGGTAGTGGTGGMGGTVAVGGAAGTFSAGGTAGTGGLAGLGGGAGLGGSGGSAGCASLPERCDGVDNNCAGGIDEGGVCPQGCTGRTFDGHVYVLCHNVGGGVGWNAAATRCADGVSTAAGVTLRLANIESKAENDFVLEWIDDRSLSSGVWMGANDTETDDTWVWGTGSSSVVFFHDDSNGGSAYMGRFTDWGNGRPNGDTSGQAGEDCGHFDQVYNWKWNDRPCTNPLPGYLCEQK